MNGQFDDFDDLEIHLGAASDIRPVVVENVRPKGAQVGSISPDICEVFVESGVVDGVWRHVSGNTRTELGGILLGTLENDSGLFVRINAQLEARYTSSSLGSLTFTHETWSDFADRISADHSSKRVVGWYHSHPGHGIFLSRFDTFVHKNFFRNPWQCAWVIDPVHRREGMFQWKGSSLIQTGYYFVGGSRVHSVAPEHGESQSIEVEQQECASQTEALERVLEDVADSLGSFLEQYDVIHKSSVWTEPGKRFSGKG